MFPENGSRRAGNAAETSIKSELCAAETSRQPAKTQASTRPRRAAP
jgi:hypothetical protein